MLIFGCLGVLRGQLMPLDLSYDRHDMNPAQVQFSGISYLISLIFIHIEILTLI